ncbi:type VI secretion system-associated FHA domain protein TagH [Caballeronia mineralivorans]|uniref:type VI secretion system-associated FHA domain protein TagH n=1 Tax=Caballeronia mineralivorans TaxID=2010198 RepID=UPI002AFEEF51|nr:type VI secretion system-associated FHA domain protein TagH [Caballeronia mineralivorans]MEA3097153.1 type secretion system protein [Caballeronia mineralivorans]
MSKSRSLSMHVSGGSAEPRRIEAGGQDATLGRAPDCTLVLPDDQRVISRVQARIEWRGGNCVLVDLGSNPTLVNGHALDGSREALLRSGDTLRIGAYSVAVVIEPAGDQAPAEDAPYEMPGGAWTEPPKAATWHGTQEDAPLIPPLIPPDWDAHPKAAPAGKGPTAPDSPFLDDPLAATPLLRDRPAGGVDANQNLLAALGSGSQPLGLPSGSATRPVAGPAFERVSPERAMSVLPLPVVQHALIPDDYDALAAATMSGDAQDRVRPRAAEAEAGSAAPAGPDARIAAMEPEPPASLEPREVSPPKMEHRQDTPPETPAQTATGADLVFAALLDGLGLDAAQLAPHSKPGLARVIGAMLREATQGTMAALRSRSVAKLESRMAMTLIEPRDNNPLKFFPDVDTALGQMLGRPNTAYLGPQAAMRAAFRDLQGHELAVVAGMRAALGEALANIAPERIEASLRPASGVAGLLVNHRARLWQQFVDTYEHAVRHADDDFQQTFGESFSRAYHAQLSAMSRAGDE